MGEFKRYLVFSGDTYYPAGGWDDYRTSCETLEEARTYVMRRKSQTFGWDWWQIVDLETGRLVESS